jgi:hypothetical protein
MGRSPVQGIAPKRLIGFIVSEVNSESEQIRGSNAWGVLQQQQQQQREVGEGGRE